jgi:hypothetical protein
MSRSSKSRSVRSQPSDIARRTMSSMCVSLKVPLVAPRFNLSPPPAFGDRPTAAAAMASPAAADMAGSVSALVRSRHSTCGAGCCSPGCHRAIELSSSASAGSSAHSSILSAPAAAPSASPSQATTAAALRPQCPLPLFFRSWNNEQCGSADRPCRRRYSVFLPQPLRSYGCSRPGSCSARYSTRHVAAAVLLYLSCVASFAGAQEALCFSAQSSAALSVARYGLAATSLPIQGLAIFAGGYLGL